MAAFVLYNVETTKLVTPKGMYNKTFASASAALRARTVKGLPVAEYAVTDYENFWKNIEKKEVRVNLMSGKEFETNVNDNYSTCPSSESYWSN